MPTRATRIPSSGPGSQLPVQRRVGFRPRPTNEGSTGADGSGPRARFALAGTPPTPGAVRMRHGLDGRLPLEQRALMPVYGTSGGGGGYRYLVRAAGRQSWSLRVGDDERMETALWVRLVERIDVPAGGTVPGSLLVADPPAPSAETDLTAPWHTWWASLVAAVGARPALDDPVLAGLPELRRVVEWWRPAVARWRGSRGRGAHAPHGMLEVDLINEVQASFGGAAVPFQLAVVVLPVDDDDIRALGADRYLVPERFYLDPGRWRAWLELVAIDLSTP